MKTQTKTMGWGVTSTGGAEIWDAQPVFKGQAVTLKDKLLLFFYPKKWFLYQYIAKSKKKGEILQILDVGCGTGATVIDLKKMFGNTAEISGVDVVQLQIDLAKQKLQQQSIKAHLEWYDGVHFPYQDESFDTLHTSDVLGHVENVPAWLQELNRILRPGGTLAMFSESKLGPHAFIRNYLFRRGLNVDPHSQYHISLYSKKELQQLLEQAGFTITKMYGCFWAKFFVHPDELHEALQAQTKFPFLKAVNCVLYQIKKKTHPFSTAFAEVYGLIEMLLIGRWLQTQGYIILAKKNNSMPISRTSFLALIEHELDQLDKQIDEVDQFIDEKVDSAQKMWAESKHALEIKRERVKTEMLQLAAYLDPQPPSTEERYRGKVKRELYALRQTVGSSSANVRNAQKAKIEEDKKAQGPVRYMGISL